MAPLRGRMNSLAMENILFFLLIVLIRRRRQHLRYQRGSYCEHVFNRRPLLGEYYNYVQEVRQENPQMFFSKYRMYPDRFDMLLAKVKNRLAHHPTHRNPIGPGQRLAITLRFVAFKKKKKN